MVALALPSAAHGQGRWVVVATAAGSKLSQDVTTVRTFGTGLYGTWSKLEYIRNQSLEDGRDYRTLMYHNYINCRDGTIGTAGGIFYDAAGAVVDSTPDTSPASVAMSEPVPGSFSEAAVTQFCRRHPQ